MEEDRAFEQTPMPKWLNIVALCFWGCGFLFLGYYMLNASNSSLTTVNFAGVNLAQIIVALLIIGALPNFAFGIYDMVRQWHKLLLSMKVLWLILTVLIITFILLVVIRNLIVVWIVVGLSGLLLIALGWVLLNLVKESVRKLFRRPA